MKSRFINFKIHIVTYFFINMKCDEFIQLKYSPPPPYTKIYGSPDGGRG